MQYGINASSIESERPFREMADQNYRDSDESQAVYLGAIVSRPRDSLQRQQQLVEVHSIPAQRLRLGVRSALRVRPHGRQAANHLCLPELALPVHPAKPSVVIDGTGSGSVRSRGANLPHLPAAALDRRNLDAGDTFERLVLSYSMGRFISATKSGLSKSCAPSRCSPPLFRTCGMRWAVASGARSDGVECRERLVFNGIA